MPANLIPHAAIPDLATHVSPVMIEVLRRVQKTGSIMNGKDVDAEMADILRQLTELELVDPDYNGNTSEPPYRWFSNGNGSRVLGYLTGIRAGPHYEIPAVELAAWLEKQGNDRWWTVDGDSILTGRLPFPCPADELAAEMRTIGRSLLVQAKKDDAGAKGQVISKAKVDELVGRFAENIPATGEKVLPARGGDRILFLCWKGSTSEWLLIEDSKTTSLMAEGAMVKQE